MGANIKVLKAQSEQNTMLSEKVDLKIEVGTLATLIAGLYCTYSSVDPVAIPTSVFIELAEKIQPYLEKWDYSTLSFEEWVKFNLIIMPQVLFSEEELDDLKKNQIYFERENGNMILVVSAEMIE